MASLMLGAISLSDKLIRLMLGELLSGTAGACGGGRAGAQLPRFCCVEQATRVRDAPGQGKGNP